MSVFINGTSLFNYADGIAWDNNTNTLCGAGNSPCTGNTEWNRDAIPAEMRF